MADEKNDAGNAVRRDKATDTHSEPPKQTGAGQEAASGNVPEQHDHEHQSNYGGGGVHGGSADAKEKKQSTRPTDE